MAKTRKQATTQTLPNFETLLTRYYGEFESGAPHAAGMIESVFEAIGATEADIDARGAIEVGERTPARDPWLALAYDALADKPGAYAKALSEREASEREARREASEIDWRALSAALDAALVSEPEGPTDPEPTRAPGESWGAFGARHKAWRAARVA